MLQRRFQGAHILEKIFTWTVNSLWIDAVTLKHSTHWTKVQTKHICLCIAVISGFKAKLPARSLWHEVLLSTATPAFSNTSLSTARYDYWPGCQQASVILRAIITATALQLWRQHPLNLILPDQGLCLVCSPGSPHPLFGVPERPFQFLVLQPTSPSSAKNSNTATTSCTFSPIKFKTLGKVYKAKQGTFRSLQDFLCLLCSAFSGEPRPALLQTLNQLHPDSSLVDWPP